VSTVGGNGFLNLIEVAEPQFCTGILWILWNQKNCLPRNWMMWFLGMTCGGLKSGDNYMSMTTHTIDYQFVMHHRNLITYNFPGRHTAVNIAKI